MKENTMFETIHVCVGMTCYDLHLPFFPSTLHQADLGVAGGTEALVRWLVFGRPAARASEWVFDLFNACS